VTRDTGAVVPLVTCLAKWRPKYNVSPPSIPMLSFMPATEHLPFCKHYVRLLYSEVSLPREGLCGLREGPSQTASLPRKGVLASA